MTDETSPADEGGLPKQFDHAEAEARIYAAWEADGCFKPAGTGDPFCMVIPPPNVTGHLHMGHALNNTLQDILIRFNRMRGKNVLWQVGTDHAGIATQMVVERQMMERQEPHRREIGRAAFLEKVWAWKEESGGAIQRQLKRLGASCDWSRERFTMDEGLSRAVRETFVRLYNEKLIYRDKRLVNWDPKLLTAISDLEVETREVKGHMWHFDYPLKDGQTYRYVEKDADGAIVVDEERNFITVATTRPETMLGDTAVAVHPDDERYEELVATGAKVVLPLVGREIPVIADDYADPEQGTGAVKITPAHDFNDFEVGVRHDLEKIVVLTFEGRIEGHDFIPEDLRGLDRFKGRDKVVAAMEGLGRLRRIEDKKIQQPFGDRSNVVIEPMLTDQWYVDAKTLAGPALEAVKDGRTRFIPESWTKTYFNWLEDIQPWCISRQLWWGHQIPVWYGPDATPFCAHDETEARTLAKDHYGNDVPLIQDEDVLDTWFSSALWPFSTLGWPQETKELETFYPTATLSTAFDIIFFWVARMMMMGLHLRGDVPFHDVYIHAIVRDSQGQKMSKSKGNVVDPLVKMDEVGTDPLRFTLAAMAAPGRDVKLSDQRIEGYRNFRTKLWNAVRFAEMNGAAVPNGFDPAALTTPLNQWIVHEAAATEQAVTAALDNYRFDEAASAIYAFAWGVYCDWYLELAKPVLNGEDEVAKAETRGAMAWTRDRILTILHPFMPFVTEELWQQTAARDGYLMLRDWAGPALSFPDAAADLQYVIDLVSEIRSVRTEMNVPVKAEIPLVALGGDDAARRRLDAFAGPVCRLARIEAITHAEEAPTGAVQIVVGQGTYALPVAEFIDLSAELKRLEKELGKTADEIAKIDKKLGNESFVAKAPPEVVAEQNERRSDFVARHEKLSMALSRLKQA